MGFWDFLANAAETVVDAVGTAVETVVDAVETAVETVKDKLGFKTYDSHSVESRVDVEKELANFRSSIEKKAREAEEKRIMDAMEQFDDFARTLRKRFPELVDLVTQQQAEARSALQGTIINYVQEHVSENNPEFEAVLKMQLGREKADALGKRMNETIEKAESVFRRKLRWKLKLLNMDLEKRLEHKIESEEQLLSETTKRYEELERQTNEETLDLDKLETECTPVIEAATCIQHLLEQAEVANS